MIWLLAGVAAAAMCILLGGAALGWHLRGDDVRAAYRYGFFQGVQWSRQRGGLQALGRIYRNEKPW